VLHALLELLLGICSGASPAAPLLDTLGCVEKPVPLLLLLLVPFPLKEAPLKL
jgi:hypothetical protein